MPYDEGLAERLREVLADRPGIIEKPMFGGLALMHRGHMLVGIIGESLMARVGPDAYADCLEKPFVRPMDFTGKPLKGFVFVDPPGFESDADLEQWVARGLACNATLPMK